MHLCSVPKSYNSSLFLVGICHAFGARVGYRDELMHKIDPLTHVCGEGGSVCAVE